VVDGYGTTAVEAHDGTVTADSRECGGSTFTVWLPLVEEQQHHT
jgi:signal transduction histidine kinase